MYDSNKTKKNTNSTRSLFFSSLLSLFVLFESGSLSNSTWHVPETEAKPRKLEPWSSTASQLRSILLERQGHRSSRSARPDGPYHRVNHPRRLRSYKAVAYPVFHPSMPREPHGHRQGHDFARKFDRCIHVAAARVGLRGCASRPIHPKSDSASSAVPAETAGRCPRRPGEDGDRRSPCWLPDGICLRLCVVRSIKNKRFSSIGPKGIFFAKVYSNQIIFIYFFLIRL